MTSLRQLAARAGKLRTGAWYLVVGPLLFVSSVLPLHSHGTQLGGVSTRGVDAVAVLAIALECLPITVSRRWPAVSLALVAVGFCVDQLRGYHSLAGTALPITLLITGFRLDRHRRVVAAAASAAYAGLAVALAEIASGESAGGFVTYYLALVLAWAAGTWLRSAREAEAERRRRIAEDTRTAERTRIARELHDVVTHHVTAMVVQAESARYLTAKPERLDETLTAVTDTGRQAITDLRHLLDLLNPDHGTETRAPAVGRMATLVEQTRKAGQPVEFTEEGAPSASHSSCDLVAYRVLQEALTNALKYARGSRTSVHVRHGEKELTVEVSTDPAVSRAVSPGGSGRGLAGLRERVDVLGGVFSAGPRPDGGFVVRARIPVPVGSPS